MRCRSVLGIVTIAALAACGAPQVATTPPVQRNAPVGPDSGRAQSWMLPEAKNEDLLYVSNVYTITAYSYPKGKLVGTLSDFEKPYGECVDARGNVYVTDSSFGKIYEYAHGGTKPIKVLKDPSYQPYGCAIDPTTGNLAVANYEDASARTGNVAIYPKAKGTPISYIGYGFYYYYYCGYDSKGNLFVDGLNYGGFNFEFGELPKRGAEIKDILLPNSVNFPGGIEWDGKYVAVGDGGANIYQYTFSSGEATQEGTTTLTSAGNIGQFAIMGSTVVTPNEFFGDSSSGAVLYYPYPAGGSSTQTITNGVFYPFAAVISRVSLDPSRKNERP